SLLLAPHTPPPALHPLSLHDALPISSAGRASRAADWPCTTATTPSRPTSRAGRSTPPRTPTATSSRSSTTPSPSRSGGGRTGPRSEEHTSELQSLTNLVCRLLLEKKK